MKKITYVQKTQTIKFPGGDSTDSGGDGMGNSGGNGGGSGSSGGGDRT